ncbi:opacity protein-like surface antigen [Hymenobacter luteus]|uniref:Opacity protein-like surface antigen n=2 Tax=Hymenobacter TaxID=89966 RepID=A0A7W9SZN8_9BACT|nr:MULTISPECIES: hypothetical protein [Hymenobacter]MBB4599727.1 opacity protein-like surface antigen [Hymenobacter latericoloratus]MBB6057963.1 opacity protein-like surface antigen [Hymenobacter luteus]
MKTLLLVAALLATSAASAQTASSDAALAKRLNQLMRDPAAPETEVRAVLDGCHFTQVIRKYRSAGQQNEAVVFQVSHQKNGADWAVKSDDKVEFELKLGVEWSQVTSLTYAPALDEKTNRRYFEVKIKRERTAKNGSGTNSTTLELPLYTSDEAVARDLVRQLEQVRRRCAG